MGAIGDDGGADGGGLRREGAGAGAGPGVVVVIAVGHCGFLGHLRASLGSS